MKKTILACVAMGCVALTGAAVAAEGVHKPHGKTLKHRDPMQASAAMNSAAMVPVRYDSNCRAQFGFGSAGYTNCLQRLPATALISR